MLKPRTSGRAGQTMTILSILMLSPDPASDLSSSAPELRNINEEEFNASLELAHSNHVIVRAFEIYRDLMLESNDTMRAGWAADAVQSERGRIARAIEFLSTIVEAFDKEDLDVTVIKSLDHWPDFGSDIDLYTNAPARSVVAMMRKHFDAKVAPQSWGDRLASKWNFNIPGLSEAVEVHTGRLGQTGEQLILASHLHDRARVLRYNGQTLRVPSASDRIMISTLQRMYRHFYFRLCDIVDSAGLIESGALDFEELRTSAQAAGIWEGVATYLVLVSDYVLSYRGTGLGLPRVVTESARFNGSTMYVGGPFLRVPIMPQSVGLYRSQVAALLRRRELGSSARLGLLPWLATAAAIGQKITGSDKGIW
jgi:hypothetical protein